MDCDYCGKHPTLIEWKYYGEIRYYCGRKCQLKAQAYLYMVLGVATAGSTFILKTYVDLSETNLHIYWGLITFPFF